MSTRPCGYNAHYGVGMSSFLAVMFTGKASKGVFKKNLNAAKPPEQSKGLGGIRTLAVRTKLYHTWYMILKGFPNVIT